MCVSDTIDQREVRGFDDSAALSRCAATAANAPAADRSQSRREGNVSNGMPLVYPAGGA
jgi:hypothetical protein